MRTFGKDRYDRTLADVVLPDGDNLKQQLVKVGMCWWYCKYAPRNAVLEELETDAGEKRMGLWAEAQPIPPWEWRKAKRPPTPYVIRLTSSDSLFNVACFRISSWWCCHRCLSSWMS